MVFKNSVPSTKEARQFFITKTNRLMMFEEMTTVYYENHMKSINEMCVQNAELPITEAGGTHSYHRA